MRATLGLIGTLVLWGSIASADPLTFGYVVSTLQQTPLDPALPTHVVIAGLGEHVGYDFQEAAVSDARRLQSVFPNDQVLLLMINEDLDSESPVVSASQQAHLDRWQLQQTQGRADSLRADSIVMELQGYSALRSIDIFAHSATEHVLLSDDGNLFGDQLSELVGHFTADAYVFLHGCNAGWEMAPLLARTLGLPVAGALTSTNFERLHSSGNYYFVDPGLFPKGPWSVVNDKAFAKSQNCQQGGCWRMRPDDHSYDGIHGQYDAGLPFYKFFCSGISESVCHAGMRQSMLGFLDLNVSVVSSRDVWKKTVQDFLCPMSQFHPVRAQCRAALNASDQASVDSPPAVPFYGNAAVCDFEGCHAPHDGERSATFLLEYREYLKAFDEKP